MTFRQIADQARRNKHTVLITARKKDGSVVKREIIPMSIRGQDDSLALLCKDLTKGRLSTFLVDNIIHMEETEHSY